MIGIWAYLVLSIVTLLFLFAVRWIFLRIRSWSFIIGCAMIFLWTLAGAWPFIGDAMSGFQGYRIGLNYHYLMEKMFPFELNADYVEALIAYGVFLVGLFLPLAFQARSFRQKGPGPVRSVMIDHRRFFFMGLLLMLIAITMVVPIIRQALADDVSFYLAINNYSGPFASLRSLAEQAASFCIIFGYSTYLVCTWPGAWIQGEKRSWLNIAFPILLALLGLYSSLLGDRQIVFTFFLLSALYLGKITGRKAVRIGLPLIAICVGAIVIGGWIRDFSWSEISHVQRKERTTDRNYHFRLESIQHIPEKKGRIAQIGRFLWTNEMFAAHFSMYGVLHRDVPVSPGISLRYLFASLTPSFIDPDRPPTAYDHYGTQARLTPGQGYRIHHATAWYINAGWPGIFIGGSIFGGSWVLLMRAARSRSRWIPGGLAPLLPLLFVAFMPGLLRAGPEAYKMIAVEAIALPIFLLFITATRRTISDQRSE